MHEIDGLLKNMDEWEKPEKVSEHRSEERHNESLMEFQFPLILPHLKEEEDDVWLVREPLGVRKRSFSVKTIFLF